MIMQPDPFWHSNTAVELNNSLRNRIVLMNTNKHGWLKLKAHSCTPFSGWLHQRVNSWAVVTHPWEVVETALIQLTWINGLAPGIRHLEKHYLNIYFITKMLMVDFHPLSAVMDREADSSSCAWLVTKIIMKLDKSNAKKYKLQVKQKHVTIPRKKMYLHAY